MSEIRQHTRYTGVDRRAPRLRPGESPLSSAVPPELYKTGGRHAAITNSLYSWHSYKSWADKIRGTWDEKK
jgi:hypothetical protein